MVGRRLLRYSQFYYITVNYYEILEIEEDADSESIKKAYKKLAKKFHPDLNPDDIESSEEKFKKIN